MKGEAVDIVEGSGKSELNYLTTALNLRHNPNVLVDETEYVYDAAGKRIAQVTELGRQTYAYTAGYQLDTITETGEVEDYDYDANGRLTAIQRDGQTLDLEHDVYDRLTQVENETTGTTTRYVYDSAGRRVSATEGTNQRMFLVTPAMGSGLESTDLMTDGAGNLISNYIYAGGSSPFMRLDANGNPVYYLTDGMGSVIGLADGAGTSTAKFGYDSFGQVRSTSGVAADSTGGDFRFQGQWLDSATGLYNFRARDYDARTGAFLSRDPADPNDQQPESLNSYQFGYNNPYLYSDPTGMFTIMELNATMNVERTLQGVFSRQFIGGQAKSFFKEKTGEVVGNVLNGVINRLLPGSVMGEHFNKILDSTGTGGKFEKYLRGQVCGIFNSIAGPYADRLWMEPAISSANGIPSGNGLNCKENFVQKGKATPDWSEKRGHAKPDFLIKNGFPKDYQIKNPDAYLVGDIKITIERAVKKYALDPNSSQWQAMYKHASKYQILPFATFIGFSKRFGKSEYSSEKDLDADIKKAQLYSLRKGVVLYFVSLFD